MDPSLFLESVTLLVAVGGVVGGFLALRQSLRQQRLELGGVYLQRYWIIDDDLLRMPEGSPEHILARHRYLTLCEDELEAAQRKWFDEDQWNVWHEWLTKPNAIDRINDDLTVCDPDREKFELVRTCLGGGERHIWEHCPARVVST